MKYLITFLHLWKSKTPTGRRLISHKGNGSWAIQIAEYVKKFVPKELPKPMGRWGIEHCNKKMNNKIDLSNEDHCGPCGQYALTKTEIKKIDNTSNNIEKTN